jgi:hypothetical protein
MLFTPKSNQRILEIKSFVNNFQEWSIQAGKL